MLACKRCWVHVGDAVCQQRLQPRTAGRQVGHLVHAGPDVAAGEPLQLLAGLQQQAAPRDGHRHAPPVAQPHMQAGEARLAVDGQAVEVLRTGCRWRQL